MTQEQLKNILKIENNIQKYHWYVSNKGPVPPQNLRWELNLPENIKYSSWLMIKQP